MIVTASTIRDTLRGGARLTPPEAVELWNTALENDPEGCNKFSEEDSSGFFLLVWLGSFGFVRVASDVERFYTGLLSSAEKNYPVYLPPTESPTKLGYVRFVLMRSPDVFEEAKRVVLSEEAVAECTRMVESLGAVVGEGEQARPYSKEEVQARTLAVVSGREPISTATWFLVTCPVEQPIWLFCEEPDVARTVRLLGQDPEACEVQRMDLSTRVEGRRAPDALLFDACVAACVFDRLSEAGMDPELHEFQGGLSPIEGVGTLRVLVYG